MLREGAGEYPTLFLYTSSFQGPNAPSLGNVFLKLLLHFFSFFSRLCHAGTPFQPPLKGQTLPREDHCEEGSIRQKYLTVAILGGGNTPAQDGPKKKTLSAKKTIAKEGFYPTIVQGRTSMYCDGVRLGGVGMSGG